MPWAEWSDELCTGIASIDGDHKRLLGLLNELHEAVERRCEREVLGRTLEELTAYVWTHFEREEHYMRLHHYPQSGDHHREHREYTDQVGELRDRYRAALDLAHEGGGVARLVSSAYGMLGEDVLQTLKTWLVHHIRKTDGALGQFLRERRV